MTLGNRYTLRGGLPGSEIEFANPPLEFDDIRNREHKIREMLSEIGIQVKTCNIKTYAQQHDNYEMFKISNSRTLTAELALDLKYKQAYTLEWTLEMSDRMVCELLEMSKTVDEFHRRMCHYESESNTANREVHSMRLKNNKLKNVLQENPGLKDQWDELMVMCKIAGLDENIV